MRLIDADALWDEWLNKDEIYEVRDFLLSIDNQETIYPVKHAHRVRIQYGSGTYDACSACGRRLSAVKDRFCGRCGAMLED